MAVIAVLAAVGVRASRSRSVLALTAWQQLAHSADPLRALREQSVAAGGGAFLGFSGGAWVTAEPEHAVMVIGPPRSGKTSEIVIPALLALPRRRGLDIDQARCPARDAARPPGDRGGVAV